MEIEQFLQSNGISFDRFDHPPVFTCEEARQVLPADMPGFETKNLFLRDKKGKRHFLVVVGYDKQVSLKALADAIGVQGVSFASPERLKQHLGVDPGSVTLLGVVNDPGHAIEVIIDQAVWDASSIRCHPLVNTATLVIAHAGIEKFLQATGHQARIADVPSA